MARAATAKVQEPVETQPQATHQEKLTQKKTPPEVLYDNQHGTKVKLWQNEGKNGPFTNVSMENNIPDGNGGWEKRTVRIDERDYEKIAEALAAAKDMVIERKAIRQEGQKR